MLLRRPPAVLLLLAALVAGCGGDEAPQTKEGFISAADNVCQDLFSEFAQASSSEPDTPQEVADANNELADTYDELAERLADVSLPASGAARTHAQAFVRSVDAARPLLDRLRKASSRFVRAAEERDRQEIARAGNDVRVALDAFRAARARSDQLAIRYGLRFCGNLG